MRMVLVVALVALVLGVPRVRQAASVESRLLQAVAERPGDPAPFIALARHYYGERRLELAARTIVAAVNVGRDEAGRPAPPAAPPGIRRAGIDVPLPVRTRNELPTPGDDAIRAGANGVVVVEAVIDADGRVQAPRVVESVPLLDDAVVRAVNRWRFEPTLADGRAVSVTTLLAIDVTYRTEPEPDRDLALAAFYARAFLYAEAEPRLMRALAAVRQELDCYGPDEVAASRRRVGQRGRGVGGNEPPIAAPTKVHDVNPLYPTAAIAARVQGVVIIETVLARDGGVRCARILRSVPILDQSALDAVRQWRFTPALANGQPIEVVMTATVNYTLR